MTMAKKLPLLAPSIHTFEVNGTYTDCEAKRTVFMAIQKMVSAEKYYRVPYHGSSKKGYSYKRKDGGLTITLAEYPDFRKRYITLSGVNLARIAGDPLFRSSRWKLGHFRQYYHHHSRSYKKPCHRYILSSGQNNRYMEPGNR